MIIIFENITNIYHQKFRLTGSILVNSFLIFLPRFVSIEMFFFPPSSYRHYSPTFFFSDFAYREPSHSQQGISGGFCVCERAQIPLSHIISKRDTSIPRRDSRVFDLYICKCSDSRAINHNSIYYWKWNFSTPVTLLRFVGNATNCFTYVIGCR